MNTSPALVHGSRVRSRQVRHLLEAALGAVLGCSGVESRASRPEAPPRPAASLATTASPSSGPPPSAPRPSVAGAETITAGAFVVPVPDGYYDATAQVPKGNIVLVLAARESARGYLPTMTIQKVPIPGGSFDDAATCAQTGRGLVQGGTESPGTGGVLKSALIIDGPLGKTCQVHLVAPVGVAIITELHRPGNTPLTPQDIWLMTCNHADGDDTAEAVCRHTLSGIRFRDL